jgi:hypothetical protein
VDFVDHVIVGVIVEDGAALMGGGGGIMDGGFIVAHEKDFVATVDVVVVGELVEKSKSGENTVELGALGCVIRESAVGWALASPTNISI